MFVHAVYFWLKEGLTQEELAQFQEGIHSLTSIESVQQGHVGVPADTDREVIDSSYSYALVVVFADQQGHDDYQVHPVHDKFRQTCAPFWTRVRIYDSVG
jgi:hypothetical protein